MMWLIWYWFTVISWILTLSLFVYNLFFLHDNCPGSIFTEFYLLSICAVLQNLSKQSETMIRHYDITPMQYTAIFNGCKNCNFMMKNYIIFLIFAKNIDRGYTLEPSQCGCSNEYTQSVLKSKNEKNNVYPCKPQFYYI